MTIKKIKESALISKWTTPFDRANIKECHLYWCISPNGDEVPKDLFMLDIPIQINILVEEDITPEKKVKEAFNKSVDKLYADWNLGKIKRKVVGGAGEKNKTRTLIPNERTIFITIIPDAYEDVISHYKE